MADFIFTPIASVELTDELNTDTNTFISTKCIAAMESSGDSTPNFKINPDFKYELNSGSEWAEDIVLEFIPDENDYNNIYRRIKVTNIPEAISSEREASYYISYNSGKTTKELIYKILQKRHLTDIVIRYCSYTWIAYNWHTLLKLNIKTQGLDNLTKYFSKNNLDEEITITDANLNQNLESFNNLNKQLTFSFYNNPISINVLNDIDTQLTYNPTFMSSEGIIISDYNVFFRFEEFNNLNNCIYKDFKQFELNLDYDYTEYYNQGSFIKFKDKIKRDNSNNIYYFNKELLYNSIEFNTSYTYSDKLLIDNNSDTNNQIIVHLKIRLSIQNTINNKTYSSNDVKFEFIFKFNNDGSIKNIPEYYETSYIKVLDTTMISQQGDNIQLYELLANTLSNDDSKYLLQIDNIEGIDFSEDDIIKNYSSIVII